MLQWTSLYLVTYQSFSLTSSQSVSTVNFHYRNITMPCKNPLQGPVTGYALKFSSKCSCTVKTSSYQMTILTIVKHRFSHGALK